MTTHLIIFAHPNSDSFTRAMATRVVEATVRQGVKAVVRDLYNMNFNPVLSLAELKGDVPPEILQEQQYIREADFITLIYPLWWMGFPAVLKGYLDRVLTHGFAYKTDETGSVGLLSGKKMQQFINIGSNVQTYQENGYAQGLDVCLVNGLFNFCGITDIRHSLFGSLYVIDDAARSAMLDEVEEKTRNSLSQPA
ncbi:flavodoxin family protein [Actinobacillus succinogenes]|uniref:NAD(P)H dehydrogenase (Quinone) n=1 Tax=Actinobacillus succinogenes (strain ATCC 55618 / DSM 22257 / CCUG 43843 / 130Z) TaxID=339671 RepID=A6VMX2_ACTSZ|nr:NAD(P)H-dependent oxidoreductase [Actinobacillus succinogenes]ABR74319.1 NAD(P)H dehydrogenase (quinone) [Actinobacillus succinogenes 130Z]PHI39257.1 flavodoxin family protein [Actinobacillus succinogenes]